VLNVQLAPLFVLANEVDASTTSCHMIPPLGLGDRSFVQIYPLAPPPAAEHQAVDAEQEELSRPVDEDL
jgi:hypothetical protein